MSQFVVYIKAPEYLAQWIRHEYWNEETQRVEFPRGSGPRAVLAASLRKQPKHYVPPTDTTGLLPVAVPTYKGQNPASANYLPETGKVALVSACKRMFQKMVFEELHVLFEHDVQITDIIYDFMDRHGIENDAKNWETIRQIYYRLRDRSTK